MVAPLALILWGVGHLLLNWPWSWWALWPIYPVLRKWRSKPFVMFAICGRGSWRLEKLSGGEASAPRQIMFWKNLEGEYYLSRVQEWTRWHFMVLWPLQVQFMFFPKAKDVAPVMTNPDTDGKLWFTYLFCHFDADWVYWCPSGYVGRNTK